MRRPLQPPARPDAVPLPEGASRDWLRHPGPVRERRFDALGCRARRAVLHLREGDILLDGIAREMDRLGAEGGLAFLDGLAAADLAFVMPDGPNDDVHAAWYSDTRRHRDVWLEVATASIGRKDGDRFVHCHARWQGEDGRPALGHLLCDQVRIGADADLPVLLIEGVRLEVEADDETGFPLFRPRATRDAGSHDAVVLTIQPHTDIRRTIEAAAAQFELRDGSIHGIGSLIGAQFLDGPPMRAPVSEVVVLPGARLENGTCTRLPVACVDHEGTIHQGDLAPGFGPVCVTCELLIAAD